jgi:hypothetical protein
MGLVRLAVVDHRHHGAAQRFRPTDLVVARDRAERRS